MKTTVAACVLMTFVAVQAQNTRYYLGAYEDCIGEVHGVAETESTQGGVYKFTIENGLTRKVEFLRNGIPEYSDRNDAMQYCMSTEFNRTRECIQITKKNEFGTSRQEHDLDRRGYKRNEFTESDGMMLHAYDIETDTDGKIISKRDKDIINLYRYDEDCNLVAHDLLCTKEFKRQGGQTDYVDTDSFRLCSAFRYEYGRQHDKLSEQRYDENMKMNSVITYAYDSRFNVIEWVYYYDEKYPEPGSNNPERSVLKYDESDRPVEKETYESGYTLLYIEAFSENFRTYYNPERKVIVRLKYDTSGTLVEVFNNLDIRDNYYILFLPQPVKGVEVVKYVYGNSGLAKRLYHEIYLDGKGNPAENEKCVSRISHIYDDNQNIECSEYYDISGNLLRQEFWEGCKTIKIGNVMFSR